MTPTVTTTDTCHHCGYRIPADATLCTGCGRRHAAPAPVLEARPLRRSPMLREARWARRFLAVAGWLGLGLVLVALARELTTIDELAAELDDGTTLRLDHAGRLVSCAALLALGLAALAIAVWTRRTHRNAVALGVADDLRSPWSLPGWLLPGNEARAAKARVDQVWRESSPLVGALPRRGSSRRIVSRVVLRWWSLWVWLPATVVLVDLVRHTDDGALADVRALAAVAAGALLVATARAYYDVVGIITVAHAHQAERVVRDRWDLPWDDETTADHARV